MLQKAALSVLTELPQAKLWVRMNVKEWTCGAQGSRLECSRAFIPLLFVQSDQGFVLKRLSLCPREAPEEATPGLLGVTTVAKMDLSPNLHLYP